MRIIDGQYRWFDLPSCVQNVFKYIGGDVPSAHWLFLNTSSSYEYSLVEGTEFHIKIENPDEVKYIDINDSFYQDSVHGPINEAYLDLLGISLYVPVGCGYAYRHHKLFSQFDKIIIEETS